MRIAVIAFPCITHVEARRLTPAEYRARIRTSQLNAVAEWARDQYRALQRSLCPDRHDAYWQDSGRFIEWAARNRHRFYVYTKYPRATERRRWAVYRLLNGKAA